MFIYLCLFLSPIFLQILDYTSFPFSINMVQNILLLPTLVCCSAFNVKLPWPWIAQEESRCMYIYIELTFGHVCVGSLKFIHVGRHSPCWKSHSLNRLLNDRYSSKEIALSASKKTTGHACLHFPVLWTWGVMWKTFKFLLLLHTWFELKQIVSPLRCFALFLFLFKILQLQQQNWSEDNYFLAFFFR